MEYDVFCDKKIQNIHVQLSMFATSRQMVCIWSTHGLFTFDDWNNIMTLTYFNGGSGTFLG